MEGKCFGEARWHEDGLRRGPKADGVEPNDGLAGQMRRICGRYGPAVHQAKRQMSGCMDGDGPLEALAGTMNLRAEYNYLLNFAEDDCFYDSHLQNQLRVLWTAFCIHAGWEADTEPYDSTMMELWNRVCGRPDGWPDFGSFDDYMCEFLA